MGAIDEACERPYQQAVDHLRKHHEIYLGKELLESVCKTVGDWWLAEDRQKIEQAKDERACPPQEHSADRCLVFADGVMVHTDGAWHEMRVGTVRSETENTDGTFETLGKSALALQSDVQDFGEHLWLTAHRMGYRSASVRAFIADGSHWLWNLADRHFGGAIKIVDFWHVCEHAGKCARAFFGEGSDETKAWSLEVTGLLRAGWVDEALEKVERLNPRRSKALRDEKHELVTYLRNNRKRMDYPAYEAMGLPIGSGEVEAQCKTLVQQRCKQAGMRWHRQGIEPLLRIRCALRDGRYDREFSHWKGDLAAWQLKRKGPHSRAA